MHIAYLQKHVTQQIGFCFHFISKLCQTTDLKIFKYYVDKLQLQRVNPTQDMYDTITLVSQESLTLTVDDLVVIPALFGLGTCWPLGVASDVTFEMTGRDGVPAVLLVAVKVTQYNSAKYLNTWEVIQIWRAISANLPCCLMHQIQLTQLILILCKWNRSSGIHSFGPTWKIKDNFIPANHFVMK